MSIQTATTGPAPGTGKLILAYFLIYVVWGSTYFFIGTALRGLPPFLLGAIRFSAAGLVLLALSAFRGEKAFKTSLVKKSAVSGVVLLFIDMAVVMLAQQYLSSSLVAIMASSTAIWIMALDMPMWKTNFRNPARITGIMAGFAGVALLFIEQAEWSSHETEHGAFGILLLMGGCISWALGTLYAKYCSSCEEAAHECAGAAWQMLFAGGAFWVCSCLRGDWAGTRFSEVPVQSWYALAYLIVFGSILAYSSYIWLLKVRPATEVATHAYVNPVVAILMGTMLGAESITWMQIAGLLVILSSIALIGRKKDKS